MNRPLSLPLRRPTSPGRHFGQLALAFLGAACAAFAANDAPAEASPDAKDHVLFLGLNLFVVDARGPNRVERLDRHQAEVVEGGNVRTIPISQLRNYECTYEPKVSGVQVQLDEYAASRVYSAERDPVRAATREQQLIDSARIAQMDSMVIALNAVLSANAQVEAGRTTGPGPGQVDPGLGLRQDALNRAQTNLQEVERRIDGSRNFHPLDTAPGDGAEDYDVLEVTFRISSPVVLENAHAVLVSSVGLPTKPESNVRVASIEALPTITDKPRLVRIQRPGLPPGFTLHDTEVHIFSEGREIATDRSLRRVELSESEATQFALMQYLVTHRREDLPPRLMTQLRPTRAREPVTEDQLERKVKVQVNADGEVVDVQFFPAGPESTDRPLESLVRASRFFPALVNGNPVDGEATLTVASFVR